MCPTCIRDGDLDANILRMNNEVQYSISVKDDFMQIT